MYSQLRNRHFFCVKKYFLLAIFASLSFPTEFTLLYAASVDSIICSFIHAIFSGVLAYRVISASLIQRNRISVPILFILMNTFYINVSSIKYFSTELYPGFITNNWTRLLFSILSIFVILVTFEIINKQQRDYSATNFTVSNTYILNLLTILLILLIGYSIWDTYQKGIMYIYYSNADLRDIGMEQSATSLMEKLRFWLMGISINILPILLALRFRIKGYLLFMITGFIIALLYAIVYGTRVSLFNYYFGFTISLFYLYRIGKRYIIYPIILAPLVIAISSVTLMPLTKRMDVIDTEVIMQQLTYRFDLTDFAATSILKHTSSFDYQLITDAFIYSIPKAFFPDKFDYMKNAYQSNLEEINLNPDVDYTDTAFSVGSQLFGIVGFIFIPFFMVILLSIFERGIHRLFGAAANIIIISCFPLYLRVENDLNGFFTDWRTLPLYILIGLMLFGLFIRSSSNQSVSMK